MRSAAWRRSVDHHAAPPNAGHPPHQTWIQKYIFPGGLLPSTQAIIDIIGNTRAAHRRRTALRRDAAALAGTIYAAARMGWRTGSDVEVSRELSGARKRTKTRCA